jgi:hypothetical protein
MPLDVVERHPKRVKAAVRHCARLGNMSAKQVAALAAEGRFPDPFGDLDPHEIPASYVGAIMRDERARMRREAGAPAEQLLAELRSILAEDVRSIRRRRRGETRIRALQAAAKATSELVRLEQLLASGAEKDGQQKNGKAEKDAPSTEREAQHRAAPRTARRAARRVTLFYPPSTRFQRSIRARQCRQRALKTLLQTPQPSWR